MDLEQEPAKGRQPPRRHRGPLNPLSGLQLCDVEGEGCRFIKIKIELDFLKA